MTEACRTHYKQLYDDCYAVLDASFVESRAGLMSKSHAFIADLGLWVKELHARPEAPVLQSALREYQFSLLALTLGQYRAAFSALRLSLELCFATVQWSTNERELREWKGGNRDIVWAALADNENGVLSKQFVRLFSEGLADEAPGYRATAASVYRECSQYVHGNANTHSPLPERIEFDASSFAVWHAKASSVRLTSSFALAARYLTDFDGDARSRLETMILDHLGHSAGIRALLGAPAETAGG